MDPDTLSTLTQFGTAGLIAWMWLVERRATAARDQQLTAAHERLLEQRTQIDSLLRVIADNTRAVAALESGQRAITSLLDTLARRRASRTIPVDSDLRQSE